MVSGVIFADLKTAFDTVDHLVEKNVWLWGAGLNSYLIQVLPKRQAAILHGKRSVVC